MKAELLSTKKIYNSFAKDSLMKEFDYGNIYQVPKIVKVVLNMGLGKLGGNTKALENACRELSEIAGQKACLNATTKSVAGFKTRKGMIVGCSVTLRKDKMYNFLDKFIYFVLPGMRDFRGFSSKSFDGNGNYNIGFKEYTNFPEIDFDSVDVMKGLDISIVTTASTDEEAKSLLSFLNIPFIN